MAHSMVIGGTRGLGREVARLLAERGDRVSAVGRRDPPSTDKQITNLTHWVADISPGDAGVPALKSAIEREGPLSYLVFCQRYRGTEDAWLGEIHITLTATKTIIESIAPMFAGAGDRSIVLVSSVLGAHIGAEQPLSYHVSKAGLNQMSRFYAVSLGRKGIRVNCVTPFTFLKDESKNFYAANAPLTKLYERMVPLGRMASTRDIANAIAFLCSPAAAFVNGHNLYVDGGLSAVWPESIGRQITSL